MEGAGEGMVAIFQGTKHAGLRVTLIPDNCVHKRKCMHMDLGARPPTRTTQSSVETNTERFFKDASEPMCDVKYASSYQFANCKAVQSSYHVAEFPHHSTFFRHSDHFADSLRKYPVQASSEILQRITNYSNIKQNSKKQNLRSIRSLLRKSMSQQMNRIYKSAVNPNNETYRRRSLKKSISTINSKYASQKELLSYTYDYLKCISLIPRSTDVRYLTQVKRCIRNRLIDIIDDRPVVCPRIRSRYSHHKRHFHGPATESAYNENETHESCETTKCKNMYCRIPSCSRRMLNFCHQCNKCDCTPTLNKQNPLENLIRKICPELNLNKKDIPSKQTVLEPKLKIPEEFKIEPLGVDDKIMIAVSEWLKSIPVYPNFSANDKTKQEEMAFKLAENLSALKNHVDFISKAKREIMLCIKDLPMWYPPYLSDKEQFIDQIVADLLKRLVNVLEDELRYKVARAISNLSYTENVDTEKIVDDFVNKLKTIVLHPPEHERDYMQKLKPRILNFLNKLPIQSSIQKMNDVADNLVNQLLGLRFTKSLGEELATAEENKFRESILKWCKNSPELGDIDFAHNMDLIDELANKFRYYESRGANDESLQAELVKAIRVWLEDAANSANLHINSKIKNRLSNKIAYHFFGKDYNNSLNEKKSSEISTSQEALEPLLKWYYGIQELADSERAETRKAIDRLAKELNEIQSRDYNYENILTDMKEVVTIWLQNMLKKRDKHLESKVFDNFVNKLISELNVIPKRKKQRFSGEYGQCYRDILTWLKDIPYLKPETHLNQNKAIEKLVNKLNNIRKGSDIEATISEAVTKFIQSLSNSVQVRINEEDIQILKDKLFDRLQHTFKQRKRWDKIYNLYQSILSEFSNILHAYSNILGDTKLNNINNKFCRIFLENVEDNDLPNWNYLQRQLVNIFMQETKLPKNECEYLANSILTKLKKMFPPEIIRRSTNLSQPVKAFVDPTGIIEQNSNETNLHRTQTHSNDSESVSAKNKSKRKHYRKINFQAGDGRKNRKRSKMSTIYKSSNSDLDTHGSVDHYEKSKNQTDHSVLDKYEKFKASTPLRAPSKNFPTALDVESTIGSRTRYTHETLSHDSELSKQPQYLMELKNVITDWVKSIDLSTMNSDVDNVVDSIAFDIIDRQKYLQLSVTKYSEHDELEHLKYQVFRNLNKIKKYDILPHVMSKINSLYRLIKSISVPDFINPVNESQRSKTSVSYSSIFNDISHWLDGLSLNLLKSSNIRQNRVVINKLIENIKHVKMSKQYDYELEKNILLWLQNVLRNCNDKIYHELAEDLKSYLLDNAPKTSHLLKQDENISEAIIAWLQNAPFCKMCTIEDRDLQEKLALLLAANLINILQATGNEADNLNEQLMEEVQKYLKTIPIPPEFRNNIYYYKAAGELIEYLKEMIAKIKEICDGINNIPTTYSDTNSQNDIHYKDLVKTITHNWCDNLPIHLGHSPESKEEAKKIKQHIKRVLLEKLSYINLKEPNNDIEFENIFSDEIHKIFKNVPMNRELERSLPILNSILIEKLKQAKLQTQSLENQTQSLVPKKILHDTLTKTLQEIENNPNLERASLNLLKEKLADAFINLHYHESTDYELRNKLKDKLYNEINKFCDSYLERYPSSPMAADELRSNLHGILKKVTLPDTQQTNISVESSKLYIEKELSLKNATTQYSGPQFLPSTLSYEDRAQLEIIRKRVASYTETTNSESPHKDISSHPKIVGVQTDCKEKVEENVQTSKTLLPDTISYSKEIIPQVVIKEFYWDSHGSKHSMEMFVPPAITPHKIVHRKKDTINFQNQTDGNVNNNSTKAEISLKLPYTIKVSNNKVDQGTDATSKDKNKRQEHLTNAFVNSPIQKSQNNQTIIFPKDSISRQKTEKPFYEYHKRHDTYPDTVFVDGVFERDLISQPRTFDNDRYIRKDKRQTNYLEDLVKIPGDRRILTQRIYWTPENRNKENTCCAQNTNSNWGIEGACRRKCTLKHCSKCCGGFCPHPTMAFFKKNF